MSKKGSKRPGDNSSQAANEVLPAQAMLGDARTAKAKVRPVITGSETLSQNVNQAKSGKKGAGANQNGMNG